MKRVSRRDFLKQSARGAMASAALGSAGAFVACERADSGLKVIDVHVHTNFQDEVLRSQAQKLSQVDLSPEGLQAEMAENQIEQAISIGFETGRSELSGEATNPMGAPPRSSSNGEPMRNVSFVGGVNPYRLGPEGLARIEQALRSGSVKGLKIYLGYYPIAPDDDRYKRIYELAGAHQAPVIFHTGDTYSENAKVRYAHPLPIDDMAVDFRQVTFVLAHLGNPWTIDAAELLYKNPNVYADLSGFLVGDEAYFSDPRSREGIEHAVDRIRRAFAWTEDPSKFMYGSDWPLAPMKPYLAFIKRAVDAPYHQQVFYSNAKRVFKLP